ncbi:cation transporter [Laceyella putida]
MMTVSHLKQVQLHVEGMSCQHCVRAVENTVKEAGAEAQVDLANRRVTIHYDENKVSLDQIKREIEEQGYSIA